MLGRLLEFSVGARPLPDAIDAYAALGLYSVPVGDTAPGAYAAVATEDVAIGLHDAEPDGITPTFVRPELKEHVRALRRYGVEFEFLELAEDEFHRAGFLDPGGCLVRLVEARTFPPPEARRGAVPICGEFVELSVCADALTESVAFWTALGLKEVDTASDVPHGSARMQGHGLTLGLHETGRFGCALTFRADNLMARVEYLRAKGFDVRRGSPLTRSDAGSATLLAPGGVRFFIVDAEILARPLRAEPPG
jgi:catechol 2,3-dioxygenase-like lactoylglutathione lyase family enzyme